MIRLVLASIEVGYNSVITPSFCFYVLIGFLMALFVQKRGNVKKELPIILLVFIVAYFISFVLGMSDYSILKLGVYVIVPIILAYEEISTEKVLRYCICLSLISAPVLNNLLVYEYKSLRQIDMAIAYVLFNGVIATITYVLFYRKSKWNIVLIIGVLYNCYVLMQILMEGNRGIFLAFACYALFVQLYYLKDKELSQKQHIKWVALLILEIIVAVIIFLNFNNIILEMYDAISRVTNAVPSFIIKMRRQIIGGDIANGRNEVFGFFLNKTLSNPFGYGMKSSLRVSNGLYAYPHNFILQLLFEFGWIFGVALSYVSILPTYLFLTTGRRGNNKDILILFLFIVSITVPKGMISGDIWMQPQFWFMVGWGIRLVRERKAFKEV